MILGANSTGLDIEDQCNAARVKWRMTEVDANPRARIPFGGTEAAGIVETVIQNVHWAEEGMEVLDGKFL